MSRADAQFRLRIPHHLRDHIAEQAKRNLRTMNSEIVTIIATALGVPAQNENRSASEGVAPPPKASPEA